MNVRRLLIGSVLVAVALHLAAGPAAAQDKGLLALIPRDAFFFIERRGHTAIRGPFLASNLGKMAQDDAVNQFVHATRVRIGELICKQMFDLKDRAEVVKHQKLLHGLLKPFWYQPCAMFVVLGPEDDRQPQMGFLCLTGKYKQECQEALAALMKIGVPAAGTAGTRQAFTHEKSAVVWQGVAKSHKEFSLPADPKERLKALRGKTLFMTSWTGRTLCVASGLQAADSLSGMLSLTQRGKSVLDSRNLAVVMQKTALKDWAFRWFLDVEAVLKLVMKGMPPQVQGLLAALGLDQVLGMGGTGGYADKVFVRMTYVYAPKAATGLVRMFKQGGSYKKAHALAPDWSTFCLAAQLDKKTLKRTVREVILAAVNRGRARPPMPVPPPLTRPAPPKRPPRRPERPAPPKAPAEQPRPKLDKATESLLKQLDLLIEASDGNLCAFVPQVQMMVMGMMMMGSGLPAGVVLGLEEPLKAAKAVEALAKLGRGEKNDDGQKGMWSYRKVRIHPIGETGSLAVLKDRAIFAPSDGGMKAAIDAALDGTSGFPPHSPGPELARLAGDGAGLFVMDLAALAREFWPLLVAAAARFDREGEDFPFASAPSAGKMVRMLGPEIAVIQPDQDGLMMSSRGKIPFATKVIFIGPFATFFLGALF